MSMKKYKVTTGFKGSPNGSTTLVFNTGSNVDHSELGDDLAQVALDEEWIEEVKDEETHPTQDDIIAAIGQIDPDDESMWTADKKPKTEVLEDLLDKKITAAQRDEAFAEFNQE